MMRIDITDIIFDVARGLSETGCFIKPQWGPVFMALSMGMATVAIRLKLTDRVYFTRKMPK